jgi:hypothetical protein
MQVVTVVIPACSKFECHHCDQIKEMVIPLSLRERIEERTDPLAPIDISLITERQIKEVVREWFIRGELYANSQLLNNIHGVVTE